MRKVLMLAALVAFVLVAGHVMVAYAEEAGGAKAPGMNRTPVVVTDEQKAKMQAELTAFTDALAKLQAKAIEVLGEKDGKMFVMQSTYKAVMPAGKGDHKGTRKSDAGAKGEAGAKAPGERPAPIVLTDEQKAKLQDVIDAYQKAMTVLQAKAVEVLGEQDGKHFVMQTAMKTLRPEGAAPGEHKGRKDPNAAK